MNWDWKIVIEAEENWVILIIRKKYWTFKEKKYIMHC